MCVSCVIWLCYFHPTEFHCELIINVENNLIKWAAIRVVGRLRRWRLLLSPVLQRSSPFWNYEGGLRLCIAISILVTWNFRKMSKKPVGREEGGEKQTNCNRFDWVSFEAKLNLATFASCSLATCFHRKCRRSWSEIRSENKPNWRTYRLEWIISRGVAVIRSV